MDKFSLPEDALLRISEVKERAETLIRINIWNGLDLANLHCWLNNFQDDLSQYFATCLLNRLNFRSRRQTVALATHLLERVLPNLALTESRFIGPRFSWLSWLADMSAPVRFVEVAPAFAAPGKSSQGLIRLMQRQVGVADDFFIHPDQIPASMRAGILTFVFVDDFLGTGQQFIRFATQRRLATHFGNRRFAYSPLVAHIEGVRALKRAYPDLHIAPVELLTSHHKVFHENSKCFDDGENNPTLAKKYYFELLKKHSISNRDERRGYGQLELAYAFQDATPDNCLSILWTDDNGWSPLLER